MSDSNQDQDERKFQEINANLLKAYKSEEDF